MATDTEEAIRAVMTGQDHHNNDNDNSKSVVPQRREEQPSTITSTTQQTSAMTPLETSAPQDSRKRMRQDDAFGRMKNSSLMDGNGNDYPTTKRFVKCPLCGNISKKTFALGRGIATHLQMIHTPWKPTPLSRKIARRQWEHDQRQGKREHPESNVDNDSSAPQRNEYEPTLEEVEAWEARVTKILQELEESGNRKPAETLAVKDKNDKMLTSYRESLSPFLKAAAEGNIKILRKMIQNAVEEGEENMISLLKQTDRHGSSAEHWAAGGGHLACLKLLMESSRQHCRSETTSECETSKRPRLRRRDGKTCLHYAARNGQLDCIRFLVEEQGMDIHQCTGEGTTPLHMACYGGHLPVVKYFANRSSLSVVLKANEWGCLATHWLAMTIQTDAVQVRALANYLQNECGLDFSVRQHQGHSPLHKAAHRKNRHVLEWMASVDCRLSPEQCGLAAAPDEGGHIPSEIWRSVGGDEGFAKWMEEKGW